MSKTPVLYKTTHRIKFSDLDPYDHMRTAVYAAYYVDHRMDGLRVALPHDRRLRRQEHESGDGLAG